MLIAFPDRSFASRPSPSIVFEATELLAYLDTTIAAWDAMPPNRSPHKQVVRDHQAIIAPLRAARETLRAALSAPPLNSLTWEDVFAPNDTYLAANLLEAGYGLVACHGCHGVYTAMELTVYDFAFSNIAGRQVCCPKSCLILDVIERFRPIGEEPSFAPEGNVRRPARADADPEAVSPLNAPRPAPRRP